MMGLGVAGERMKAVDRAGGIDDVGAVEIGLSTVFYVPSGLSARRVVVVTKDGLSQLHWCLLCR